MYAARLSESGQPDSMKCQAQRLKPAITQWFRRGNETRRFLWILGGFLFGAVSETLPFTGCLHVSSMKIDGAVSVVELSSLGIQIGEFDPAEDHV